MSAAIGIVCGIRIRVQAPQRAACASRKPFGRGREPVLFRLLAHQSAHWRSADLKSVLTTIAADVRPGDACILRVDGADPAAAMAALRRFILEELPRVMSPWPKSYPKVRPKLPRGLESSRRPPSFRITCERRHRGRQGRRRWDASLSLRTSPALRTVQAPSTNGSSAAWPACARASKDYSLGVCPAPEAAILKAHLAILGDVTLRREIATVHRSRPLRRTGHRRCRRTFQQPLAACGQRLYP